MNMLVGTATACFGRFAGMVMIRAKNAHAIAIWKYDSAITPCQLFTIAKPITTAGKADATRFVISLLLEPIGPNASEPIWRPK